MCNICMVIYNFYKLLPSRWQINIFTYIIRITLWCNTSYIRIVTWWCKKKSLFILGSRAISFQIKVHSDTRGRRLRYDISNDVSVQVRFSSRLTFFFFFTWCMENNIFFVEFSLRWKCVSLRMHARSLTLYHRGFSHLFFMHVLSLSFIATSFACLNAVREVCFFPPFFPPIK